MAMASTVSTGHWPETHGVFTARQPHPDRLGYELACPERATRGSVWTAAASSGRHVAIGNWPHAVPGPDLDGGGRFDRIDGLAIDGIAGEPPAVCPPDTVDPTSIRDILRTHEGKDRTEVNCLAIEMLADQGPDLMLGWLAWIPGEIEERRSRIEGIRRRLGDAGSAEATLLVLEHPIVAPSVFQQSLRTPPPLLHVFGPRTFAIGGRPRIDVISSLVAGATGIEPTSSRFRVDSPSGGQERLDAARLPGASRISMFDLKQFDYDRNREIGASLVARGQWAKAEPWLTASIQTQHGRLDVASFLLLMIRMRRTRGEQEADRLLASVMDRFPSPVADLTEAWIAGRTDEVIGEQGRAILKNLGPFLTDAILIDLQRRGLLKRSGWSDSEG